MCWAIVVSVAVLVILNSAASVRASDIVHDDTSAPKKPGCENNFVLVWCSILCFGPDPIFLCE